MQARTESSSPPPSASGSTGLADHEYGYTVLAELGCEATESRTIRWTEIETLRGQNALDLGPTSWQIAALAARLAGIGPDDEGRVRLAVCLDDDDGIDDSVGMPAVRELFFGEWERLRDPDWSVVSDLVDIEARERIEGLNATDAEGPYFKAAVYALSLLDTFAELFERPFASRMKVSAAAFRDDVRNHRFRVHLGSSAFCNEAELPVIRVGPADPSRWSVFDMRAGNVRAANLGEGSYPGPEAYALFDIYLCNVFGVNASLADYYFWWARRLLTKSYTCRSLAATWYFVLAWCAAKAALAEIVEMAGTIIHEYGHIKTGGGDHCLAAFDVKLSCATYLYSDAFQHGVRARLALPRAQLVAGYAVDPYSKWDLLELPDPSESVAAGRGLGRFDYKNRDDWWFGFTGSSPGDLECQPFAVQGLHCRFWSVDHGVTWSYSLPKETCVESRGELSGSELIGPRCDLPELGDSPTRFVFPGPGEARPPEIDRPGPEPDSDDPRWTGGGFP